MTHEKKKNKFGKQWGLVSIVLFFGLSALLMYGWNTVAITFWPTAPELTYYQTLGSILFLLIIMYAVISPIVQLLTGKQKTEDMSLNDLAFLIVSGIAITAFYSYIIWRLWESLIPVYWLDAPMPGYITIWILFWLYSVILLSLSWLQHWNHLRKIEK